VGRGEEVLGGGWWNLSNAGGSNDTPDNATSHLTAICWSIRIGKV